MTPLRIEASVGKISQDAIKSSSSKEAWHILKKNRGRFDVSDDSVDGRPQPSLVVETLLFSCGAPRLARKPRSNAVHCSTPLPASEIFKRSAPNRCRAQSRILHPRQEKSLSVGFPLDETHSPRFGQSDANSLIEHRCAGTKAEHKEVGMSHNSVGLLREKMKLQSEKTPRIAAPARADQPPRYPAELLVLSETRNGVHAQHVKNAPRSIASAEFR
jgi:hypothetical protein